ncbi:MAG: hypothetical protein AB7P02_12960 [Alphaproteobacteria bacterium]
MTDFGLPGARPVHAPALRAAMDRALEATTEPPRGYLGGSVIGEPCQRRMWYAFRQFAPVGGERTKARIRRIFQAGHDSEARMVRLLSKTAGLAVQAVNPLTRRQWAAELRGGFIKSHFDGVVRNKPGAKLLPTDRPHLLELKSMKATGWKSFDDLVQYGVYAAHPKYYAQMQCYMHATHMEEVRNSEDPPPVLDVALFVAERKDDSELYDEIVEYDPMHAMTFMKVAEDVIDMASPPPRGRTMKVDGMACRMCGSREICYGLAPFVVRSCRQCVHAAAHARSGAFVCLNEKSESFRRPASTPCGLFQPPEGHLHERGVDATATEW